ncbi:MAG: restriction endonuclease subunit S [Immundisolibacter sp.]|uniref:restriction endonuclease subunit S n=1 Tax=Immundisolibacter sp. TaxID=1934948 RepID=UPI003EE0E603
MGTQALVIAGQSPEGKFYNQAGQGLPFYQGKKDFGDRELMSPTTWTAQTTKEALPGDILMSVRAPVGPINFARERVCIGRGLAAIRCRDELDPDFLFYQLLGMQAEIAGKEGAVFASVNKAEIEALPIFVPPLPEQRRIVAILDEAFEGIATAKGNAKKNLQNARELFESYLQAVFTDCGPSWVSATIDQHIRFIDYRGRTPEKTSEGLRLITAKNVKKGFIQQEPMEFVAPESYASWMTRGIPKVGDVLFTTEAPLGNVAQLDTEDRVVFAQRVIIMQADPAVIESNFLKYMLLSAPVQSRIHAQATGATAQGIKASLLKRIEVAFPQSLAEQQVIVDRLDALAEESNRLEELYANRLVALDSLKKSLLHQAFSGHF